MGGRAPCHCLTPRTNTVASLAFTMTLRLAEIGFPLRQSTAAIQTCTLTLPCSITLTAAAPTNIQTRASNMFSTTPRRTPLFREDLTRPIYQIWHPRRLCHSTPLARSILTFQYLLMNLRTSLSTWNHHHHSHYLQTLLQWCRTRSLLPQLSVSTPQDPNGPGPRTKRNTKSSNPWSQTSLCACLLASISVLGWKMGCLA